MKSSVLETYISRLEQTFPLHELLQRAAAAEVPRSSPLPDFMRLEFLWRALQIILNSLQLMHLASPMCLRRF
jgi:hypothetical protein